MKPTYITIADSLFETAASETFEGSLVIDQITQGADVYRFPEPLTYNLTVTNTGGAFLVIGVVEGRALTTCARCLDETSLDLCAEVEDYYLINGSDSDLSPEEKDEYEVLGEDHKINLTQLCISALALEFPYVVLCKNDCKGLCPKCGANLNYETCTCEEDIDDSNPFSVLKDLPIGRK